MKKVLLGLITVISAVSIIGCSSSSQNSNNPTAGTSAEQPTQQAEVTSKATYENCTLELTDAACEVSNDGKKVIRVNAVYTNNGDEPLYAYCSFSVKAFQNDVQITEVSDINGAEANLIKEVKNGKSIDVSYVFEVSDGFDAEIIIGTPTADCDTIGKKIYSVKFDDKSADANGSESSTSAKYAGEYKGDSTDYCDGVVANLKETFLNLNADGTIVSNVYNDIQFKNWEYDSENNRIGLNYSVPDTNVEGVLWLTIMGDDNSVQLFLDDPDEAFDVMFYSSKVYVPAKYRILEAGYEQFTNEDELIKYMKEEWNATQEEIDAALNNYHKNH